MRGLQKILKKAPIELGFLYGSRIQGNITKFSDYDLAVLINEKFYAQNNDSKTKLEMKLNLLGELFEFFSSENVDLLILNEAPINLKYKVIQKGKLIYYNEINTYYQFKASVILEFLDFNPIFNFYQRILYKKVGISHA